jgi:hypothetical protein
VLLAVAPVALLTRSTILKGRPERLVPAQRGQALLDLLSGVHAGRQQVAGAARARRRRALRQGRAASRAAGGPCECAARARQELPLLRGSVGDVVPQGVEGALNARGRDARRNAVRASPRASDGAHA